MNTRWFASVVLSLLIVVAVYPGALAQESVGLEELYERGRSHYHGEEYARAQDLFQAVLERSSEGSDLHRRSNYFLGRILKDKRSKPIQALKYFYRVYHGHPPDNLTDDALYFIAEILIKQVEQPEMALPYLKVVEQHFPNGDYHQSAVEALNRIQSERDVQAESYTLDELPRPKIKLNFEKVDVKDFVATYAELSGKNFLYSPDVQGKVTILSRQGIPIHDLFNVFLSVLKTRGYTATKEGHVYRVQRTRDAVKDGVSMRAEQTGLRSRLYGMEDLPREDLKRILESILPSEHQVAFLKDMNRVLVTSTPKHLKEVDRMLTGLKAMGLPADRRRLVQYAPRFASARRLQQKLENFLPDFMNRDDFQVVADRRSERVYVAVPEGRADFVRRLANRFDQDLMDRLKVRVFRLEHADQEQVAKKLREVLGVLPQEYTSNHVKIVPDARQKAVVVSADSPKAFEIVRRVIKDLDKKRVQAPKQHHVYKVRNSSAGPLAEKLNFLFKDRANAEIRVTSDEQTNSLIISAPENEYAEIKRIIKKLDAPKKQVMIDAFIVEASTERVRQLGIEWGSEGSIDGRELRLGTQFGQGAGLPLSAAPALQGLNAGLLNRAGNRLLSTLHALDRHDDFKILSTAHLVSNENEEASLSVGEIIPILTDSQTTPEGAVNQSFDFENVGIDLEMVPNLSAEDAVTLDISQKIQEIEQTTTGGVVGTPTRRNRDIQTTVAVPDGLTLVLGGVIRTTTSDNEQRVPVLGEVPLLQYLFQAQSRTRQRTNLLVFLRPRVLQDAGDLRGATERLKQEQNLEDEADTAINRPTETSGT